jgi:transcriptional regulator with XRE-family HTH domain
MEVMEMRTRKLSLGTRNLVGARVTQARLQLGMKQVELLAQLQLAGIEMSVPALSLLEGQKRPVSDLELNALADILHISADWLLGRDNS